MPVICGEIPMDEKIDVTIRFESHREDLKKLKQVMKGMEAYQVEVRDRAEAKRLFKEELQRRLREAGLSR